MFSFYGSGGVRSFRTNDPELKDEPSEVLFVADKALSIKTHKQYMLSRLMQMFEYKGLPETIPSEMLELGLLLNGVMFITKVNGELYALIGGPGGEPDPYYRPTKYVVANPALKFSATLDIKEDGVLMRNDKLWTGLSPLVDKYASILAENEITIRVADIMLRIVAMLTSPDDNTKVAAEHYLKRLQQGKLGVAAENRFFDGIKMQSPPSNNGSYLTQFIELEQYMKASFYNEVGMQANYNMKRENIGSGETAMNQNATLPLCDQMLAVRQEDVAKVNEMFGTNISVEFNSAWKLNAEELRLELEQMKAELENAKMGSQLVQGGFNGSDNGEETDDSSNEDDVQSDDNTQEDPGSPEQTREEDRGETGGDADEDVVDEENPAEDSDGSTEDQSDAGDETPGDSSTSEPLEVSQLAVDVEVKVNVEGGEEDATDDGNDDPERDGSEDVG